ncbi:MAG: type II toxin-antitoxin system HigB family toxin [Desulfobacula sp.]|nr:type II toxin-antitoxin system HigB family toxin [Desulfobacula sp.]
MNRIFAKSTLRAYWKKYPDSEQYLKTWYDITMSSDWTTPADVKQTYANASILKENRIVFNIKGDSCRLVVKFNFEKQWIFIRSLGHIKSTTR